MRLSLLPLVILPTLAIAGTINIPADYPTIQEGIDAASNGDTVLIQPGLYRERIMFLGKNIVVGSVFINTGDTSSISSTIIDGDSLGTVVTFGHGEDSTAQLIGLTITNGWGNSRGLEPGGYTMAGGGIICANGSSPQLSHLIVRDNSAPHGGGIYIDESEATISHTTISSNSASMDGGGVLLSNARATLYNVIIDGNNAAVGGGFFSVTSSATVRNTVIRNNRATNSGGGLYISSSTQERSFTLTDSKIINNKSSTGGGVFLDWIGETYFEKVRIDGNNAYHGGAIYVNASNLFLSAVDIVNNEASNKGGGIFRYLGTIEFDPINRCNVYLNKAFRGRDLFYEVWGPNTYFSVIVDTFTLSPPNENLISPVALFTSDILHSKLEMKEADLYVSLEGDDFNSGLTELSPFKTISWALAILSADSLHPHTIQISNGEYSSSYNGEVFPLSLKSYVTLSGQETDSVVLNADWRSRLITITDADSVKIENITAIHGRSTLGGGIYIAGSSAHVDSVTMVKNMAEQGGGLYSIDSYIQLQEVTIDDNTGYYGGIVRQGGGIYGLNSEIKFTGGVISKHEANDGSGIAIQGSILTLRDVEIASNGGFYGTQGGGISSFNSSVLVESSTIADNSAVRGSGLYCRDSDVQLIDVIVRNNEFKGNSYSQFGAGIFLKRASFYSQNTVFAFNYCPRGTGGGIYADSSKLEIENTTLAFNSTWLGQGGGIYSRSSQTSLINSIIWGNSPEQINSPAANGSFLSISYTNFPSGYDRLRSTFQDSLDWLAGNIDAEPLFCNVVEGNFHLAANSVCLVVSDSGSYIGALGIGCDEAVLDIYSDLPILPDRLFLNPSYPNPFNPNTTLSFELPTASDIALIIYDLTGREVARLADGGYLPGYHQAVWDGRNASGRLLPSGIYIARLHATPTAGVTPEHTKSIKMLLLK